MIHYTVVIPLADEPATVRGLLTRLGPIFERLVLPYEIICVDDASFQPAPRDLENLLATHPQLRLLRFDEPRGTSAALTAGIAAARGDLIIALSPDTLLAEQWIPQLIARLSQSDLVVARLQPRIRTTFGHRIGCLTRWLRGDAHLHAGEALLWVARREAVSGLALARGAFRALPSLVGRRGMRVWGLTLSEGQSPRGGPLGQSLVQRLASRWLDRRFEPHLACEVVRGDLAHASPRLAAARRLFVPPGLANVEQERRDSA